MQGLLVSVSDQEKEEKYHLDKGNARHKYALNKWVSDMMLGYSSVNSYNKRNITNIHDFPSSEPSRTRPPPPVSFHQHGNAKDLIQLILQDILDI